MEEERGIGKRGESRTGRGRGCREKEERRTEWEIRRGERGGEV